MTNKSRFILFFSMFLTFDIHSAAIKLADDQRSVNLTVNVIGSGNATNETTVESTSLASNTSRQYAVDHKIDFGILSSLSNLLSKSQSLCECSQRSFQFFEMSKFKICALCLLSSYIVAAYKLHLVHELIVSHESWCNWKEVVALSHLVASSYEDTVKQLHIDIAKKYFSLSAKEPNQSIHTLFLKEVEEEISLLKNYLWWSNGIKTLHCVRCFYLEDSSLIQEKLARLNFMLDIFIKWQVEHPA